MPEPESLLQVSTSRPTVFDCVPQRDDRGTAWLQLSGELDLTATRDLAQHLNDALAGTRPVVVDLRGLTFMDCVGLRLIVAAHKGAQRGGPRLTFVRGLGQIERLVELTGLDGQLTFTDPAVRRAPWGPEPPATAGACITDLAEENHG